MPSSLSHVSSVPPSVRTQASVCAPHRNSRPIGPVLGAWIPEIRGLIASYDEQVDVVMDGLVQERLRTIFA